MSGLPAHVLAAGPNAKPARLIAVHTLASVLLAVWNLLTELIAEARVAAVTVLLIAPAHLSTLATQKITI